jgi:monoamine oxidase
MRPERSADAIVIGAGVSGLVAARGLELAGWKCLVLEARNEVGGRTLSRRPDNRSADLGGEFINSGHRRMLVLVSELGLRIAKAKIIWPQWRDRRGRLRKLPDLAPGDVIRVGRALWRLAR